MKRVLFIGPYRQNDGWGNAAKEYLRAFRLVPCELAARPVYLANDKFRFGNSDEFCDLEAHTYDNYEVIIQNTLPSMFRRYGNRLNIGLSYFETSIKHTPWPISIDLMDQLWVSSAWESNEISDDVSVPVNNIPIPTDLSKFDKKYEYHNLDNHKHEFKFYTIGELNSRKNLHALIIAMNREFQSHEKVRLVLKINSPGLNENQTLQQATQLVQKIEQDLGMYKDLSMYHNILIISKFLSTDELYGLHNECDCFISASSGEAFCMPAFDAVGFGSQVLVNSNSGMNQYTLDTDESWVNSYEAPAISQNKPLPFLYNGRDTWYNIDIIDLQRKMRAAYETGHEVSRAERKEYARQKILPNYSYEKKKKKIGSLIDA